MPVFVVPLLIGAGAALVTLAGGLIALRWRQRLSLLVAVAGGVVLGVALFDLLPEAVALGARPHALGLALVLGFGGYLFLGRGLARRSRAAAHWLHHLAPATLTLHSLFDGLGIGLAFQADTRAGWLIATAVLTHDLIDGVNIVGLGLALRDERSARVWLAINGAAPLLGVLLGSAVRLPPPVLAAPLAAFSGAFLYIGAGELVPRGVALNGVVRGAAASLAGLALMAALAWG